MDSEALILSLAAILALLVMLALFGGSETALTTASRPLMHTLAADGDRRAALVNRLLARRERLLGSILLGNTLVHILATSLATSVAIGLAGEAGVAWATAVMTVVVLVLAEILPKTLAIRHANRTALMIAPTVRVLVAVCGPAVHGVHWVVNAVLKLVGAAPVSGTDVAAAMAELRGAIEVHAQPDEVRTERRMLRSILDLAEVDVGEVMTHRSAMETLDADQPPGELIEKILASPYSRIPLWRNDPDNIIGVIHAKDALRQRYYGGARPEIARFAAAPWYIPDTTTLIEQLQAFRDRREHFALVVDEYGTLQGVVTLEDILEEIVGEIADEHDVAVKGSQRGADGSVVVAGITTIRDLNREFEWRLPDDDAATIGGLILHEARRIPDAGQVFLFHGFRFEILRRHKNQIASIRITPEGRGGE